MTFVLMFAGTAEAVAQGACPNGGVVPDLGYGFVSCHDCLGAIVRDGVTIARFTGEPALHQIRADGPGSGLLSEGDTLVAVDSLAITSEAAAIRLATFRPGAVRLTLRRNGVLRTVAVTARPLCVRSAAVETAGQRDSATLERQRIAEQRYRLGIMTRPEYERAMGHYALADSLARIDAERGYRAGVLTREAYERVLGHYAVADSIARDLARRRYDAGLISRSEYLELIARVGAESATKVGGDTLRSNPPVYGLGLGIECSYCSFQRDSARGPTRWTFSTAPVVAAVEAGSVAAQLGLRVGDTLQTIDDIALTSAQGGARLGALGPSSSFSMGWRRGAATLWARRVAPTTGTTGRTSPAILSAGHARVEIIGGGATWSTNPRTHEVRIRVDSVTIVVRPGADAKQ